MVELNIFEISVKITIFIIDENTKYRFTTVLFTIRQYSSRKTLKSNLADFLKFLQEHPFKTKSY